MIVNNQHSHPGRTSLQAGFILLLIILIAAPTGIGQANQSAVFVGVSQVDSSAFPKVTALVSAIDTSGPLDYLKPEHIRILEDGVSTQAKVISLENATQETHVALAFDLTVDNDAFLRQKESTKTLIDSLPAQFKFSITTFSDAAARLQDLTDSRVLLKSAIDKLTPQGYQTRFYDGILVALDTLKDSKARKALVIFTNSGDNVGSKTPEEVIARATALSVPVYMISYKDIGTSRMTSLKQIARVTGGQVFTYSLLDDIQSGYRATVKWISQGNYRLIYQSGIKADNAEHELTVEVTSGGVTGRGSQKMTALQRPVTVNFINLFDKQTVGGVVILAAEIKAPAPVEKVVFSVNDQVLKELTTSPYRADWDSSKLPSGAYTISVKVVDQAGNPGQARLNLTVVQPITVWVRAPKTTLEAGEKVKLTADVTALELITRVSFSVDGANTTTLTVKPYEFTFDSAKYPAGEHTVAARARDVQGREKEQSIVLSVTPKPAARLDLGWLLIGLRYGLTGLLTALGVVAAVVLLVLLTSAQKRRSVHALPVTLTNEGNISTTYQLRLEEPSGELKWIFKHGRKKLEEGVLEEVVAVQPKPGQTRKGQNRAEDDSKLRQGYDRAQGIGNLFAGFLNTLSLLLPGSAGRQTSNVARDIRYTQATAHRIDNLQDSAGRLGQNLSGKGTPTQPGGSARSAEQQEVITRKIPYAETPLVEPGESLQLELLLTPKRPFHKQVYPFFLYSKPASQPLSHWQVDESVLKVKGLLWIWRTLPYIVFILLLAGILLVGMPLLFNLLRF